MRWRQSLCSGGARLTCWDWAQLSQVSSEAAAAGQTTDQCSDTSAAGDTEYNLGGPASPPEKFNGFGEYTGTYVLMPAFTDCNQDSLLRRQKKECRVSEVQRVRFDHLHNNISESVNNAEKCWVQHILV